MKQVLPKLVRDTTGLKLFPLFTALGWLLIGFSVLVGVLLLGSTSVTYWGGNAKVIRDAAEIGSPLLNQLVTLSWWPKLLPLLIFFGVASFMLGIAMQFAAIPAILDRRTAVLKQALPLMGRKQ